LIKLKKGPFCGGICLPGGGINPGELGHEAVRREIKEETGIELNGLVNPIGFCELMREDIKKYRVVLLFHSIGGGEPLETEEGIAFWGILEKLKMI